ncbi:MAG TPA: hypothetical protein VL651_00840, partial [Bacteroidia bacterium]|nr:hypothetical protein [Bacteroidia bacterium]
MKPYIEHNGSKFFLPQEVNAEKFEMNVMEHGGKTHFLLCPKVKTRYVQASGGVMVVEGKEMKFTYKGRKLAQGSFPVGAYETLPIQIDYKAASATPVSMASDV